MPFPESRKPGLHGGAHQWRRCPAGCGSRDPHRWQGRHPFSWQKPKWGNRGRSRTSLCAVAAAVAGYLWGYQAFQSLSHQLSQVELKISGVLLPASVDLLLSLWQSALALAATAAATAQRLVLLLPLLPHLGFHFGFLAHSLVMGKHSRCPIQQWPWIVPQELPSIGKQPLQMPHAENVLHQSYPIPVWGTRLCWVSTCLPLIQMVDPKVGFPRVRAQGLRYHAKLIWQRVSTSSQRVAHSVSIGLEVVQSLYKILKGATAHI